MGIVPLLSLRTKSRLAGNSHSSSWPDGHFVGFVDHPSVSIICVDSPFAALAAIAALVGTVSAPLH